MVAATAPAGFEVRQPSRSPGPAADAAAAAGFKVRQSSRIRSPGDHATGRSPAAVQEPANVVTPTYGLEITWPLRDSLPDHVQQEAKTLSRRPVANATAPAGQGPAARIAPSLWPMPLPPPVLRSSNLPATKAQAVTPVAGTWRHPGATERRRAHLCLEVTCPIRSSLPERVQQEAKGL